jgi:hypothetical protein
MSTTSRTLAGFLCLFVAGCTLFDKGRLDPRVASQVTVSKLDPPPGCEYLGTVRGVAPLGELGDAHADVLRKAVLQGGNYVAVDLVERPVVLGLGSYEVRGRLFGCPRSQAAPVAQAAAPSFAPRAAAEGSVLKACDPDCAAGFTCQLGACVAAPAPQAAGPGN